MKKTVILTIEDWFDRFQPEQNPYEAQGPLGGCLTGAANADGIRNPGEMQIIDSYDRMACCASVVRDEHGWKIIAGMVEPEPTSVIGYLLTNQAFRESIETDYYQEAGAEHWNQSSLPQTQPHN